MRLGFTISAVRAGAIASALVLVIAACAPASPPAPTAAPAKPAAAPTSAPAQPAAAPTTAPAAKPATTTAPAGSNAELDKLIAAARAEGKLNIAGPSNLGEEGFNSMLAGMNKQYGLNIQGTFSSQGNLQQIVAKVITERSAGGKPSFDSVILNDSYLASLSEDGDLASMPYDKAFPKAGKAVQFGSTSVGFANQLVLPAVNTKLVKPEERPKTWDDLLDPRWKGKIGVHNATHHWVRLSQVWGEVKADQFIQKLAAQEPKIGLINEVFQRLELGETLVSASQTNSQLDTARKKGEPVDWAADVRPAIAPTYYCSAVKGASNPNAAMLFCGFMLEKAAQDVWGEKVGKQSINDPSTELGKIYAQDPKNVALWDEKFPIKKFEELDKKYTQTLGFR